MRVTVELSWNKNTEADLAGYKVHWWPVISPYQGTLEKVVVLHKDTVAVQLSVHLKPKSVYTFAVSAYDMAGNASDKRILKVVYVE